jgi:hypothetical protein
MHTGPTLSPMATLLRYAAATVMSLQLLQT